MRVIVVGSGIAGLVTALHASARHEVVLVTKSELAESNTRYAQGGIAAVLFDDDSVAAHVADTLRAGAGLGDADAVEVLCAEGPARVRELIELGVAFDRETSAPDAPLARGHEAAHSHRRVLHAGGDATGLAIESALLAAVTARAVEVHGHCFVRELRLEHGPHGARVVGVSALSAEGRALELHADAVVVASGGAGQLYRHTTNPVVTTGDGIAAAARAGAVLRDLEFFQFHPTALAVPGTPLISEAVRGEGAILLDERGHRFMLDAHPDGELAPRDVVARSIAAAMRRQGGRPVVLDATALGAATLAARFPGIHRVMGQHGLDWARDPVPVTPAAHYWMGGIRTDTHGRTSLPGLYAVGEAACTGVHGANRLASNSLLESLVFAARAAAALDAPHAEPPTRPDTLPLVPSMPHVSKREAFSRSAFQALMWQHVGLERDAERLAEAAAQLARWHVTGDTVGDHEDRNLLELGRLLVAAAQHRTESRGAQLRTDHARPQQAWAHSVEWIAPVAAPRELEIAR